MRAFMTASKPRAGSIVGSTYNVPLSSLTLTELEEEKQKLTMQAKPGFGVPPPPFAVYVEEEGMLKMPRFYGLGRFGAAERDDRVEGDPIDIQFTGTLRAVQREAKAAAMTHLDEKTGGVIIVRPCGTGKTVVATEMIASMKRKAAILVHTAVIRDQWKAAFETFCPGVKVGIIQGKTWEVEGYDVVLCMVMTMAKRSYDPSEMDGFGVVCCDEAHHLAAPVMGLAMRSFRAKRIIGLTATKERPDGLTSLLHYALGPEGFRAERDGGETVKVSVAVYSNAIKEILTRDGMPLVSIMLNKLAAHPERNLFIATRAVTMRKNGRNILILSDRRDQLNILHLLMMGQGVPEEQIGFFVGSTKEAERAEQLARPVVLCTYQMANEGLDKKQADTIIFATPKKRIIQAVGRVQRPCETKQPPLVLDIADDVSLFGSLRFQRQKLYSKEKYEVQVVHLNSQPDEDVWFT